MDTERKDQLRDRIRARAYACQRCGHPTTRVDGKDLEPSTHFSGLTYKVCGGCGHDWPVGPTRRRAT